MSKLSKLFNQSNFLKAFFLGCDVVSIFFCYAIALWLRFDFKFSAVPAEYQRAFLIFIPFYLIFCVFIFWKHRLYSIVWKYASVAELYHVILATAITGLVHIVAITVLLRRMPIAYYVVGIVLQFFATIGIRFSYRFVKVLRQNKKFAEDTSNVMVIGAGDAGRMIIQDIRKSDKMNDLRVCCVIDDNPELEGHFIEDVLIVGGRDHIMEAVEKYKIEKIFVAIPTASAENKRDIINICNETGCKVMNLPGVFQFVNESVSVSQMKEVSIEDLLGREPIKANLKEVFDFLQGKVIMVTGGGGSIGSELCRQIAAHNPKQLIIFDVYENNAYDIQLELKDRYPKLDLVTLIGSVRDSRKIEQVFETYKPEVVYHAAAHKHVPLMEDSPCEAIKNNAIGTYKTAYAAMMNGCKRFVLISTDKAVNPTNVMGATKRLCEMVIQSFDKKIKEGRVGELPLLYTHANDEYAAVEKKYQAGEITTEFVAVRFGNVLGSNGSVIPIFKRQIAKGGPVTVTHPDIIRYFMTIPEAVSLVLQAGTYAHGGEIFVLDMGSPVKIADLAKNLIRLSGYKPGVDIKIEYTGLRPGEKLYEEKLMAEEGLRKTKNDLIHIGCPIPFDTDLFLSQLIGLMNAAYDNDPDIRRLIAKTVTTYKQAEIKPLTEEQKASE